MISRVLITAILAGIVAGLFATGVQAWRVTPLILEAERYEADASGGGHSHDGSGENSQLNSGEASGEAVGVAAGEAEEEAWAPADGLERTFYTGLANIGIGIGFSLLLTAAALVLNIPLSLHSGLVLGVCGFITFALAPNFGLPPELPGMQAADLAERQVWWLTTVVLTAVSLVIFAFKKNAAWIGLGLVIMALPHIYGAPHPASHESLVPANLAADFAMASIVAAALFWLFLGGMLGYLGQKITSSS